jgi:hypothetical protein
MGTDELDLLTAKAKKYRIDAQCSLERNCHMNKIEKGEIVQMRIIDAVLVDFINFIGMQGCIDYGLYTIDLNNK